MDGLAQLYKIFCVRGACKWWVQKEGDSCLWGELAVCPKCGTPTDGYEINKDEGFGTE
jgi:hypothetical protein